MANEEKKTENGYACLSVTSVQVYPLSNKIGNMLGLAKVILNDQLTITSLRIMDDGDNGLFVAYTPSTMKKGEMSRMATAFPIKKELREHIEKCVLEKFLYEQENANAKFDVELTHRDLSGVSLQMEIIASNETEAESKAKEKATSIIPSTKDNGEWTILKVTKHE